MRLLIIDDDIELSRMLAEYLAGEGFSTETAENGERGVELAMHGAFDALVLDIMMPRLDGIEALRRIRRASNVPIIMLSARADNMDRVTALEMGADDYVPKPYYPLELVARIRAVLRRTSGAAKPSVEADTLEVPDIVMVRSQRRVTSGAKPIELTNSEFSILEALMRAFDGVVSKDDLSLSALGKSRACYDRSMDVHVSNIRRKLQIAGVKRVHIRTVRSIGYCLEAS